MTVAVKRLAWFESSEDPARLIADSLNRKDSPASPEYFN